MSSDKKDKAFKWENAFITLAHNIITKCIGSIISCEVALHNELMHNFHRTKQSTHFLKSGANNYGLFLILGGITIRPIEMINWIIGGECTHRLPHRPQCQRRLLRSPASEFRRTVKGTSPL